MDSNARFSVAVRVDAGPRLGTGHLMRSLTLADALRQHGAHVRFVCRDLPEGLEHLLRERGHEYRGLRGASDGTPQGDLAHSHWLPVGQAQDGRETEEALADRAWQWVVVDHYALDHRWESRRRTGGRRIMVIDDLADRRHDCDILLDQNLYPDGESRYSGKVPPRASLLLGPHFALLREEFPRLRATPRERTGEIRRVLVLLGGADASNHTRKVVEGLAGLAPPRPEAEVVIGSQHPARDQLETLCRRHGFACHVQTNDVARLMFAADLAIGAGGATSWERCCAGLPAVCLTQAANQVPIAGGLEAAGAIVNLGDGNALRAEDIRDAVQALIADPARTAKLARRAAGLVDGLGTERVCRHLLSAA